MKVTFWAEWIVSVTDIASSYPCFRKGATRVTGDRSCWDFKRNAELCRGTRWARRYRVHWTVVHDIKRWLVVGKTDRKP